MPKKLFACLIAVLLPGLLCTSCYNQWMAEIIGRGEAERWSLWADPESGVTITLSFADDGVVTVTVGGTAITALPAWENIWKANAQYKYTAAKGKIYTYSFEAWTDGADRTMNVQWYEDNDTTTYHYTGFNETTQLPTFTITSERKIYTITGKEPIPKSGTQILSFQCANQLGTFYVRIISIVKKG